MNIIWYYLVGGFIGLLLGTALSYLFMVMYSKIMEKRAKKNIPEDKKVLANPGNVILDVRGFKEQEIIDGNRTREFEKLRRLAKGERVIERRTGSQTGVGEIPRRISIQERTDLVAESVKSQLEDNEREASTADSTDSDAPVSKPEQGRGRIEFY